MNVCTYACCKEFFVVQTDYHTLVCTLCGKEIKNFGTIKQKNQSYTQSNYPFAQCYSRRKRFLEMITNIFFPSLSVLDNNVCEKLCKRKNQIKSTAQMFIFLKSLKLKDKRYGSVHAFCMQFMKNYKAPKPIDRALLKHLGFMFSEIELVYFRLFGRGQFFNYSWLILKIFKVLKLDEYCCYVKPLKCKKRVFVYDKKITAIIQELSLLNTGQLWVDDLLSFQLLTWQSQYHRDAPLYQSPSSIKLVL